MTKRTDNFAKFANQKKGSAVKEAYRQEKKKIKAEARAAGEAMRQRKLDKIRGIVREDEGKTRERGNKEQGTGNRKHEARNKEQETRNRKQETGNEQRETGNRKQGTAYKKPAQKSAQRATHLATTTDAVTQMPLNKFIAHAGICGRREAADLVKDGKVSVNGDKVFEPGYKVTDKDKVVVKGKQVFLQRNSVYILLNKPKDYITTASDPQGRKTVIDLLRNATPERIYPVGRLDRNTTGVLLLTNDGELAQKLTHPSFEVKKIYEVTLDKPVTRKDLDTLLEGVTLEDGFVKADAAGYADPKNKAIVGVEIHSGRNRIVRRIFEHLGYDVKGLDRVMFANLTKKNVERGKWRFLQEKEIRLLKFMNQSFVRKQK